MSGPLSGLRVLDCSLGTAGPQASGLLSDYGAEVTWVEPPGGDLTRRLQPGAASVFNRGKRSVVLDVSDAGDIRRIQRLAAQADVFIEGWRPGEAEGFGLGFDELITSNPHLIYCSISGFGDDERFRHLPAYEPLIHALIGTMAHQAGHRDGPIFEALPFASTGAAQLAVIGVLAALLRRFDDGAARHVDTSLWDGALAFHAMLWGESDASLAAPGAGVDAKAMLSRARNRIVTRSFLCADGEFLGIHTGAVGAFSRLMEVLGLDDRIKPSATGVDMGTPLTAEEAELLESEIHKIFAVHPRKYWVQRLLEADICGVEHLPPTAAFDEAQTRHNGMVIRVDDSKLGPVDQVAPAVRFDGAAPHQPDAAPRVGQHSEAVLSELDGGHANSVWRPASHGAADDRPLLEGIKVVDLGAYYAGPFSSRVLADFGADVIKLEPTVGDQLRGIERPFFAAQAGKRSLAANLKEPELKPAIEGLIKWADVVHHNMRPGAAERLGLGREQVAALNPAAIYLYAPGWGSSGPHMMRQSFAPMLSGYVGSSYEVAGQYNEPLPSIGNEDPGNGLLGAIALLIALLERRRTGKAPSCENPQLNAALGMVAHIVRDADGQTIGNGRLDVLQMGVDALESLYQTADGWVCLTARNNDEIAAVERVLCVDILADPQFATIEARREHRDELTDRLRTAFESCETRQVLAAFAGSGAALVEPVGPSYLHQLLNESEQRKLGRIAEVAHPQKGQVREISRLVRISGSRVPAHRLAPGLGAHSDEILGALGYHPQQILELRSRGQVR